MLMVIIITCLLNITQSAIYTGSSALLSTNKVNITIDTESDLVTLILSADTSIVFNGFGFGSAAMLGTYAIIMDYDTDNNLSPIVFETTLGDHLMGSVYTSPEINTISDLINDDLRIVEIQRTISGTFAFDIPTTNTFNINMISSIGQREGIVNCKGFNRCAHTTDSRIIGSILLAKLTDDPTKTPSINPTIKPTISPTRIPTAYPTNRPSKIPSSNPSINPTSSPTSIPSRTPSNIPTDRSTSYPTDYPVTIEPTVTNIPSESPTDIPSEYPTNIPTISPTNIPTSIPPSVPSHIPTTSPSNIPTVYPTAIPKNIPTSGPTDDPTTNIPTIPSTNIPTYAPTNIPSSAPTNMPTTPPTNMSTMTTNVETVQLETTETTTSSKVMDSIATAALYGQETANLSIITGETTIGIIVGACVFIIAVIIFYCTVLTKEDKKKKAAKKEYIAIKQRQMCINDASGTDDDVDDDDDEEDEFGDTTQLSVKVKKEIDEETNIHLVDEIKGALIFKIPLINYTLGIYIHYWIWQIPVLITNSVIFSVWITTKDNPDPHIELTELAFLAVGPVFLCALVRDKIFLWVVYIIVKKGCFCGCTQYSRYHITRLADCIGGLHSSLGVTALVWNVIYSLDIFYNHEGSQINIITATAFSLPLLLFIICLSALPCIRYYYHNQFEIVHRYFNWVALCLLITHLVFVCIELHIKYAFLRTPSVFTLLLIILTVYPWIILHRIKGKNIEIIPAGAATAYIFPYWAPMGAVCKISDNWIEFHVLGITPLPYDKTKGYHQCFVLMKSLGDWSSKINEMSKIDGKLDNVTFYMTRIKPPNFTQGLFNWSRVFVLATGAGIAPLIPYVVHPEYVANTAISLVWVARDHAVNYPKFIVDIVLPLDNVILYDTTKMPRPNLKTMTVQKAKEFNAEAVFIVSNPGMAYSISNYVNKQGIPVFASNFDV